MKKQRKIPTKEDFERASNAIKEDQKGLNKISAQVLNKFKHDGVHKIYISYSRTSDRFGCYIFYIESDLMKNNKLSLQIEEEIYKQLEQIGRAKKEEDKVDFTFNSHENIMRYYNGNYQNYYNRAP